MVAFNENDLKLTIPERFSQIVEQFPEQIAVEYDDISLTYRELQTQVQHIANFFAAEFGGEQQPVPVLYSNQKQPLPLLIGIINAGHIYSALSHNDPAARIAKVLENLDAPILVVCDKSLLSLAKEVCPAKTRILLATEVYHEQASPLKVDLTVNSYAVIIYTSGSTGEPKGVLRTHKLILHQAWTYNKQFSTNTQSRMLVIRPYSASSSLSELFAPLLNGATIVPFDLKEDGLGKLSQVLKSHRISMMRPPIQVLRTFLNNLPSDEMFPHIKYVFATGDVFYRKDVERLRRIMPNDAIVVHQFAMSEAGILSVNQISHDTPLDSEVVPAGRSVKGKELIILDENRRELPPGEVGEICVRTETAFPGYWRSPDQTSSRFVVDPQNPEKQVFTTGDLGRIRPDGQLEHSGRKDWRVKILGYSVDLSAIEHVLMTSTLVQRAVVVVLNDQTGEKRLVAYVLPSPNTTTTAKELIDMVAASLPSYMVPSLIVMVSEMPVSLAGKVDRKALPEPDWDAHNVSTSYKKPATPTEEKLVDIWKKVLRIKQIGVRDNFFELGGDSLLALEMTLEVEKTFSKTVPQRFFKEPNIFSLAELLDSGNSAGPIRNKFILESHKKNTAAKKHGKNITSKLKGLITKSYSAGDIDRIIDLLIARYIVTKPYLEARKWSLKWSSSSIVQNVIYGRRYDFLSKLTAEFQENHPLNSDIFRLSVLTNLSYGLSRYYDKSKRDSMGKRGAFRSSRFKYWQSLADLIEDTPRDQLGDLFPVNGLEHFTKAYDEGKGVIFLTAHSISSPIRLHALSRQFDLDIPTISYRVPIRQSQYHHKPKELPDSIGLTMNAEIALFGQKMLQQGQAINIVADTSDPYGRGYDIVLAGRAYRIKSGFAELALNTGAKIIPHFGGCLPDGRPELNFLSAFDPGPGNRAQQIESLVSQYSTFINDTWKQHPHVIHWRRISGHFSKPKTSGVSG